MRSTAAAEAGPVDKPAKTRKPATRTKATTSAAKPAAPRKRATPAQRPEPYVEPAPPSPVEPPVEELRGRRVLPLVGSAVIMLAAVTAAAALVLAGRWDRSADPASTGTAAAVSTQELASFASAHGSLVYWAGGLSSRTLELTSTAAGTFVRYLPEGVAVGGSSLALTVATYPMRGAYTTAARRAKGVGMTSRPTRNGGLAVWSKAQPTSIYVAFRGVPSLVEVYSPQAKEARTLALSGRLRPVR